MFSDLSGIKLKITNRVMADKTQNTLKGEIKLHNSK